MTTDRTKGTNVVLISYEFTYKTFSGNGVLARSLVKSLLQQECNVTVWCCRPPSVVNDSNSSNCNGNNHHNGKDRPLRAPELTQSEIDRLQLIPSTLSSDQKWHRLDDGSAWEEFSWRANLPESSQELLKRSVQQARAILVVDWTGHCAWESTPFAFGGIVGEQQQQQQQSSPPPPPLVYMNFRVFSSGVSDAEKRAWYDAREERAIMEASLVVALSEKDKASLAEMAQNCPHYNNNIQAKDIHVLVPPLRSDIEDLALEHKQRSSDSDPTTVFLQHMPLEALEAMGSSPRKCFITCIVRLSPEKDTRRFVRFLQATKDFWKERKWIPLLAGSSSDPDYAALVRSEMEQVCGKENCVILEHFLSPSSLAAVLSCAVVNFHPCAYDAYGMTIMEAGALGVPSIIASGGHVGASVHVENGASIEVDMNNSTGKDDKDDSLESMMNDIAITQALRALQDQTKLAEIGKEAQKRALAWDEAAYGKALLDLLMALPVC